MEGGPGYWSGGELPTENMKWRIVITAGCYSTGAATPLFRYAGKVVPCDSMGVIQVSNRMLLAPDGIDFSREGLFGVGFVRTPLGKVSANDNRNFWTFVADSQSFSGPVMYMLPEFWHKRAEGYQQQSAHLADFGTPGVGVSNGGGFAFEWNTLYTYKEGDYYKIPQMAIPGTGGESVLAMKGRGYGNADVYDPLEQALSKRKLLRATDIMASGRNFGCRPSQSPATFKASTSLSVSLGTLHTERKTDGCRWSVTTNNRSGYFPQYFKGTRSLSPVDESEVPAPLQRQKFPKKNSIWPFRGPYDVLTRPSPGGCLSSPGPASSKLYCARMASKSWIAYKWYRFVDQPGLQRVGLTASQKKYMQARIEHLHESLHGQDQWIKRGEASKIGLAEVSGAQLVNPPPGMSKGYVPIALYEGTAKPKGCNVIL